MLYIVTALYEEALPFLKKYDLKRKTDFPHFELFFGEGILLLITRPGALRAATALSSLLTAFPPGKQDFLLSAGCAGCARSELVGQAFSICRITEGASGRTRYPELLYRCPFPEAEVITQAAVQQKAPNRGYHSKSLEIDSGHITASKYISPLPVLYDMEAAGIYEAASPYFSCDKLLFLKVVSDALTGLFDLPEPKRRTQITDCMAGILPVLSGWLDGLTQAHSQKHTGPESALGEKGELFFTDVCTALRLSTASSYRLYQLMLYLALSEIPYRDSMQKLLAAPLATPCRTKKEGLKYLEQLNEYYL